MAGAGWLCHPISSPWKRSFWSFSKCGVVCKQIVWELGRGGRQAQLLIPSDLLLLWSDYWANTAACHWVCGLGYPLTPALTALLPPSQEPSSQRASSQIVFICTFLTHSRPPLWLWRMTKKSLCAVPERSKQHSRIPRQPVYKNN